MSLPESRMPNKDLIERGGPQSLNIAKLSTAAAEHSSTDYCRPVGHRFCVAFTLVEHDSGWTLQIVDCNCSRCIESLSCADRSRKQLGEAADGCTIVYVLHSLSSLCATL